MAKNYCGIPERGPCLCGRDFCICNRIEVLEDDQPPRLLLPRLDLANHSPTGFAWGYLGSGPSQLALAILVEHLGDEVLAVHHYQTFKETFVARWPIDGAWTLAGRTIDDWMRARAA